MDVSLVRIGLNFYVTNELFAYYYTLTL